MTVNETKVRRMKFSILTKREELLLRMVLALP